MSINWVMLTNNDQDYVRLPSEQSLYISPARVSISLDSVNKFPGRQPYQLACAAGKVHLTNRRVRFHSVLQVNTQLTDHPPEKQLIYIPTTPPPQTSNQAPPTVLASFAAPLTHLHDAHVTTPWLGPNAWVALVQPVLGGGIPSHHPAVEVRLTFKDGGAYDMHTRYCELRERLAQAREVGADVARARGGGAGVAPEVHLEQLPAYEAAGAGAGGGSGGLDGATSMPTPGPADADASGAHEAPAEPPPGYEETQRDSLADLLETTDIGLRQRRVQ